MKYLSIIALVAVVFSCSSPQKKTEEAQEPTLKEKVMMVHDEVMPKMGELRKTQKENADNNLVK